MLEIAPNKYIVASRIVGCRIYEKDSKIGIAISMDTVNPDEKTAFTGQMKDMTEAKTFVDNISNFIKK